MNTAASLYSLTISLGDDSDLQFSCSRLGLQGSDHCYLQKRRPMSPESSTLVCGFLTTRIPRIIESTAFAQVVCRPIFFPNLLKNKESVAINTSRQFYSNNYLRLVLGLHFNLVDYLNNFQL